MTSPATGPGKDKFAKLLGDPKGPVENQVYAELRGIAQRRMAGERSGHTLQATALVHEVYIKLLGDRQLDWTDRRRFYGAAAEAMRRVLVDHARSVQSLRRGGNEQRVTLGSPEAPSEFDPEQILCLSEALELLAAEDPTAAEVTRLRYFCGLTVREIAQAMDLSERSIAREWTFARARLLQILGD